MIATILAILGIWFLVGFVLMLFVENIVDRPVLKVLVWLTVYALTAALELHDLLTTKRQPMKEHLVVYIDKDGKEMSFKVMARTERDAIDNAPSDARSVLSATTIF